MKRMPVGIRHGVLGAAALVGLTRAAPAQQPPCGPPPPATRAAVEACLARLERTSASDKAGTEDRARDRQRAAQLRTRLSEGDFRPGDRIYLVVRAESTLTDTLTVQTGPAIDLKGIGEIPLTGVLQGDLQSYLADTIATYVRDPTVEAHPLLRLGVVGEVSKPGFYAVPADAALADVIMLAGGLTQDAKPTALHIQRGSRRLWDARQLQGALASRQTVAGLGLHEGDRIVVPRAGHGSLDTVLRISGLLLTIPAALWGLHAAGVM
jgi:protein involved in polysaccharide export with SLBB domain